MTEEETEEFYKKLDPLDDFVKFSLNIYGEEQEGDYYENGILYCGKCHEAKRMTIHNDEKGTDFQVGTPCKCKREEIQAREQAKKREERENKLEKLKMDSGLRGEEKSLHFSDLTIAPDNKSIITKSNSYAINFPKFYKKGQGLLFYGDIGTGKTHMAKTIVNSIIEKYCTPAVIVSLIDVIQTFQNGNEVEIMKLEWRLRQATLLVVDDLGTERTTDFAFEKIYKILNDRYEYRKPMICTTNMTLQAMRECEDVKYARLFDRILEKCYPMAFKGKSFRKKKAETNWAEMAKELGGGGKK